MIIIGHRGASGYRPENTKSSINLAIEQGCHGIEVDVQLSYDNRLVIFHDWDIKRITGKNALVQDLTLEQLKSLDIGSWHEIKYKDEKILTLEELIELCPNDLLLNLEIKAMATDYRHIEAKVMDTLVRYNRLRNTIITSFNHRILFNMQKYSRHVETGILYYSYPINIDKYLYVDCMNINYCNPNYAYIDKYLIEKLKYNNFKILAWTVNTKKEALRLKNLGVDGIITNYPDIIK